MANRVESAADITVMVENKEKTVTSISVTKDISVEEVYGSGNVLPGGYSITQISYSGDMTLPGNKKDLEDMFFDENGVPVESTIHITHQDGDSTSLSDVLCTSEGYEMNDGETTETTFEFIALGKDGDSNPN